MSRFLVFGSAILVQILVGAHAVTAQDRLRRKVADSPGPYVALVCKAAPGKWIVMTDTKVQTLGERRFLVGTVLDREGREPTGSQPTWVAVDEVNYLQEFDAREAAQRAARSWTQVAKPGDGTLSGSDVLDWDGLSTKIPIQYHPSKKDEIAKLRLYVSDNLGGTWTVAAECGTEQAAFQFTVPKDGEYWFALQIVDKTGTENPAASALVPQFKLRMRAPTADPPQVIPPARP